MVSYEVDSVVLTVTMMSVYGTVTVAVESTTSGASVLFAVNSCPHHSGRWLVARTHTVVVVGDPNRDTQASYWATGLLSMLPTTCCRHWVTVHSASATLNDATTGILMNECKRAETTRYGTVRRSVKENERGRGRDEADQLWLPPHCIYHDSNPAPGAEMTIH